MGQAVRGGAMLLAAKFAMQVFSWAVTLSVPRLIGARDYGVMTWGLIFLGLSEILAEAGLGRALVQQRHSNPADRGRVFTLGLMLAGSLYGVLYFSAEMIASLIHMPEFAFFLQVMALCLWAVPFRCVSLAILDREQRLGSQATAHVLMAGSQATMVLVLALYHFGYWSLAIGAMVGKVVETVVLSIAAQERPHLRWPGIESGPLVTFGLSAAGSTLLWFVYDNADFAIVGWMFGTQTLGLYSLAFLLMTLPVQKLTANVNQIVYPVFCRLQDNRPLLSSWFLRLSSFIGLVGVPALVGMALVIDDTIAVVYGPGWSGAVLPFRVLAFVGVVRLYAAMLPPLYMAVGRPDVNLQYTASCLVVMPLAFVVGGSVAGLLGVCLAWLLVYPLTVAGLVVCTRSLLGFGLKQFLVNQIPLFGATLSMTGMVLLTRLWLEPGPERLVLSIFAGFVTYAWLAITVIRNTLGANVQALWSELTGRVGAKL